MLKIIKTFRAVANAARIPLKDWVRIVPVVQAAFNAGYWERLKVSCQSDVRSEAVFHVFGFGGAWER